MDERVDVVRLISAIGHTVRAHHTAPPAFVHDLHAFADAAQRDRVHHAAARRRPVSRCFVDVQRRQAMRTVISVTAICQRPHVRVTHRARETAVLLAPAHVPAPWCRCCRAPRSWVPFPLLTWVSPRLATTRGLFTACAITSGSCFTAFLRIRTTAFTCRPLSGSFRHLPPVGVCRAHWHRRRPQIRRGRSAELCRPSHLPGFWSLGSIFRLPGGRVANWGRYSHRFRPLASASEAFLGRVAIFGRS